MVHCWPLFILSANAQKVKKSELFKINPLVENQVQFIFFKSHFFCCPIKADQRILICPIVCKNPGKSLLIDFFPMSCDRILIFKERKASFALHIFLLFISWMRLKKILKGHNAICSNTETKTIKKWRHDLKNQRNLSQKKTKQSM